MENFKNFCEVVSDFCKACDEQLCTYEIVKSDASFDSDDFILRVYSRDNIISRALFLDIPSSLYYYVYVTKDNRLCLVVR